MSDEPSPPLPFSRSTFSRRGRWLSRLNLCAAVLLSLCILVLVNFIIFRHPWRIDLTEEGLYALSDETKVKLEMVREPVVVILPYLRQTGNPQHEADIEVLNRALWVLKEFSAAQPLIQAPLKIDILREEARWVRICEEYDLSPAQFNRMVFVSAADRESRQAVTPTDLAVFGPTHDKTVPPEITRFRGEQAMREALLQLVEREEQRVYFTQGHGELAVRSQGDRPAAMGALIDDLRGSGYRGIELSLSRDRAIPADATLVVIAGPERPFSREDLDKIEKYLLDDGRLLVALGGRRTGIEDVLERWGVEVVEGKVRRRIQHAWQRGEVDWVLVEQYSGSHPITRPFLSAGTFEIELLLPRPLRLARGKLHLRGEPLLNTGAGTERVEHVLVEKGADVSLLPEEEKGNFVLAAAVRSGGPGGDGSSSSGSAEKQRATRLVVLGASSLLRDFSQQEGSSDVSTRGGYLGRSCRDFFMNCVDWLAGREEEIALGGQEMLRRELPPIKGSSLNTFLLCASVLIFPGIFLFVGVGIYFLRRA